MKQSVFETKDLDQQRKLFQHILDCIYDRIYVADQDGYVVMVNEAVRKDSDESDSLVGKHMAELVKEGYMKESLSLKILKTKKSQGHIHHEPEGYDLLAWGMPYIEEGEVKFVVCTEWDLESLDTMQAFLNEERGLPSNRKSELTYYRTRSSASVEPIAESNVMKELLATAARASRTDATILIQGESGTGKEVLMRYIHFRSPRIDAPLIEINCGAIPENLIESELFGYVKGAFTGADTNGKPGIFELAHLGTLFLDEIEALPFSAQSKLLRVLQEKEVMRVGGHVSLPVDIKIIAASNADLQEMVKQKQFREDLFYRLNVIPLTIPPLRERKEDIPELVQHFNQKYNMKYKTNKSISTKDMDLFLNYSWPGNVRELQNIIERALLTTQEEQIPRNVWQKQLLVELNQEDLSLPGHKGKVQLAKLMEEYEENILRSYLPYYENSRQFAELLGVEKSTINRKFKKYGIKINAQIK